MKISRSNEVQEFDELKKEIQLYKDKIRKGIDRWPRDIDALYAILEDEIHHLILQAEITIEKHSESMKKIDAQSFMVKFQYMIDKADIHMNTLANSMGDFIEEEIDTKTIGLSRRLDQSMIKFKRHRAIIIEANAAKQDLVDLISSIKNQATSMINTLKIEFSITKSFLDNLKWKISDALGFIEKYKPSIEQADSLRESAWRYHKDFYLISNTMTKLNCSNRSELISKYDVICSDMDNFLSLLKIKPI